MFDSQALSFFRLTEQRRSSQGEKHDFFTGHCTYVVMHTYHAYSSNLLHHCLHGRARRLDQMTPHLFELFPAFLGRKSSDEMLLGRGQNASEANDKHIID